jgi:hypothetical protein
MRPESHRRRFTDDPRSLRQRPKAGPSQTRDVPFTLDDLFQDDPTDDEVDEAIDQIAVEGCWACPRCGSIVLPGS